MFETPAARLAVARLTEVDGSALPFRRDPGQPLLGYCLISGDEQACRVNIHVENGVTLSRRLPGDPFYYEGWLMTHGYPVSVGPFNLGAAGEGSCTCVREAGALSLDRAVRVRVTAEPLGGSQNGHTAILEGDLVWLQGQSVPAPEPEPQPVLLAAQTAPVYHAATAVMTPWVDLLAGAGEPVASGPAEEAEQPEPAMAGSEEESQASAEEPAESAPPKAEEPSEVGFKLYHEPATPVTGELGPIMTVALSNRHPLAPRAAGTAALHLREGRMLVTVRGLPSPAALGRAPATDRPFNSFRVWLVSQRSGARTCLGLATRVWGENFRFESESGLALTRHDAIMVTAEDRSAPTPNPNGPQVLVGTYQT